jgi:GH25 family lysozyme M1 (1,4-beta-N-acetylmuramidase)
MTVFGWDASDYDWGRGPMDLDVAFACGVRFFTHKATEGTRVRHRHFGEAMKRAKRAGIPFRGAYVVPRTPGNGRHGSIEQQAEFFLAHLDDQAADWRSDPDFFLQVDLEHWRDNKGVLYDAVAQKFGVAMCRQLAATGKTIVHYAPRWAYGDGIDGEEPLWSSDYGTNAAGQLRSVYSSRGGDGGKGWRRYSGREPVFWQFGSKLRIGEQKSCDGNAFRGSLDQLQAFVRGRSAGATSLLQRGPAGPPKEDDMQLTDVIHLRTGGEVAYSSETSTVEAILTSTNYYVLQARNLQMKQYNDVVARLSASEAAAAARDKAALAAIQALAAASGVDPAPIVDAVNAVSGDVQTQLADLHRQLAAAQAENELLRQQLAAAPRLDPPPDDNGRGDAEADGPQPDGSLSASGSQETAAPAG